MPLKFLKKCRQYNVTSKNLFVIPVHHLLDTSTTVDCTISSESKGQECLDNVCQRLLIQQPEFFGLRYVVKGRGGEEKDDDEEDVLRWIDLDRSLSRQLEKYAAGTKIYLRVRHYVTTGVRHLSDEVTRYYYFLQLKSDIYEGKIACDIRTAILLALYCRQAEYDSYQQPTRDYTKKSLVLPKNLQGLANDDNLLDSLIMEVLHQNNGNSGIQHLSQSQAEEMYIQCCQQLDGYGEERFQAKDTLGNDLQLGLAINGMVVTSDNGRQYFPWRDFNTVTIEKRTIKIEQHKADGSIVGSFIFAEADVARYFWKLCITQHKFFKRHIDEDSLGGGGDGESSTGMGAETATFVSGSGYDFGDSREDLLLEQQQRAIYTSGGGQQMAAATTQQQMPHGLMASNVSLVDSANGFRDVPLRKSVTSAASHQSSSGNGAGGGGGGANIMHAHSGGALAQSWLMAKDYESAHDYSTQHQQLQQQQQQQHIQQQQQHHPHHLSSSFLDTRIQSTSCLDLSNNNTNASNGNLLHSSSGMLAASSTSSTNNTHLHSAAALVDAHERERLKALLPTYRPAPDYETAVQLKYQRMGGYPSATPTPTNIYYHAGSQPDVHNAAAGAGASLYGHTGESAAGMLLSTHQHHHLTPHYPDVTQPAAAMHHAAHATGHHLSAGATATVTVRTKPLPPPYPVSRVSSSSTPDLAAVATHRPLLAYGRSYVSGSSPDLVSHRNILNAAQFQMQQYMSNIGQQQYLAAPSAQLPPQHSTFENLNMIEEQPSILAQLRQAQSYDQHPSTYQQQQQQQQAVTVLHNTHSGSIEPIYENVPLPPQYPATNATTTTSAGLTVNQRNSEHRSSGSGSSQHAIDPMRNRTASIQSAPGGMPPPQTAVPVPAARHQHHHPHNAQHADRAASIEHFLEPTPPQRTARAASAAPAIGGSSSHNAVPPAVTPPPRQHKIQLMKTASSVSAVDAAGSSSRHNTTASHDDSLLLHQQFGAMNLSASSSASTAFNSTLDTTATTAHSTSTSSSTTKDGGKRKKRWNILGRSKTPDKQKSATLGREKASTSNAKLAGKMKMAQDDLNLPYRWSTGVPRLQPISGKYSKDKLCQILDEKLHDSQLFMEFEGIPKRRDAACYDCALMPENALKNSDPNFLPYDDNRVRITPTMENRHGYVNASHITATVGAKQRFYIVAQSPREALTMRMFWQCVWEADVYLVVQLSEDSNYIPSNTQQRLEFGQFQVYQEFSQTTDRCITSKLRLFHMQSRRYRSVWHLNYTDWAEQNCPRDVNHFLDFLEELNSVRMASVNEVPPGHNTNPPVLIHCHEGGGRSGVTLTAELLLYTLDHNEDLDIPRVIGQLRHQRDSIIPSLAQYKFIYSLLITYLKRTRLI